MSRVMPPEVRNEIPPGTLDMLILRTVAQGGTMHGFQIADTIQQRAEDVLRVEEGSLYPALQRILLEGWVRPLISRLIVCAGRSSNQDRVRMVKALRQWLEANELFAIVTGVVGALILLSTLLVLGGYLIVTR